MTHEEVFERLKNYFETRPAARWALGLLKPGTEIGLNIGSQIECAIFSKGGVPAVERREAVLPHFVFHMKPETIEILLNSKTDDFAEILVNVATEILTGNIHVEVKGTLKEMMDAGYLEFLKVGGTKLTDLVKTHGANSIMKVFGFIDKVKNSK